MLSRSFFLSCMALSMAGFAFASEPSAEVSFQGKSIKFKNLECNAELEGTGLEPTDKIARVRVFAGEGQKDVKERLEVLILKSELETGDITLNDARKNGTVCLVTYDKNREIPHQTFCIPRDKNRGSCSGKLSYENRALELSLKCEAVPRAINPDSAEKIDFELTGLKCLTKTVDVWGTRVSR